jgi:hypothetical protein
MTDLRSAGENTEFLSLRIIFQKIKALALSLFDSLTILPSSRVTHNKHKRKGMDDEHNDSKPASNTSD